MGDKPRKGSWVKLSRQKETTEDSKEERRPEYCLASTGAAGRVDGQREATVIDEIHCNSPGIT